jgi:hypothetical protein
MSNADHDGAAFLIIPLRCMTNLARGRDDDPVLAVAPQFNSTALQVSSQLALCSRSAFGDPVRKTRGPSVRRFFRQNSLPRLRVPLQALKFGPHLRRMLIMKFRVGRKSFRLASCAFESGETLSTDCYCGVQWTFALKRPSTKPI